RRPDEDVLELRVVVEREGAELAPDPRLLEAAERRGHAHRGVRVDRDGAGLERTGDPKRTGAVSGPDRPGEPVHGGVADTDRIGLVLERDDRRDRAEDLVTGRAVVVRNRAENRGRKPVAGPIWR